MPSETLERPVHPVLKHRLAPSVACLTAAIAVPAYGQTAVKTPTGPAALEDIIVTAQRIEERLQDVPLSVSVLTGEDLANAKITQVDGLEQLVPGLRIGRSGSDARPAMRGTYTENVAANGEPRFGVYVNEIYQSRTTQVPPLVDLDRVEVQKGPQGTLYGRNSFGGNLVFQTAKPTNTFAGGVEALYGNYDRRQLQSFVNLPITGAVAARLAGVYERSNGYIKNIGTGSDLGDEDQWYVRGTVRLLPEAFAGRLEASLQGSYWWQGGHGLGGFYYKYLGSLVDVPLIVPPGGSITVNGRTYSFPRGFNGSSFSGAPALVDTRYRDGIPDINGADIGIPVDPSPYRVNMDANWQRETRQKQGAVTLGYNFGGAKLRSITSYTDFSILRSADDLTPAPLYMAYQLTQAKTFTQELQLVSNHADSRFNWIVGAFYIDDKVQEWGITQMNRSYSTAIALATGQYPLYNFGFTYTPTLAADGIAQYRYDGFSAVQSITKSAAGYAQGSLKVTGKLTLTAGYRYTSDQKDYVAPFFNVAATPPPGSTIPTGYYVADLATPVNFACDQMTPAAPSSNATPTQIANAYTMRCGNKTFDYSTYRIAVDYKFAPDHMVYASVSTGQHAGGFNTTLLPGTNQLIPFNTEKVLAFEIGSKNTLLDGRLQLTAALFDNEYKDLQAQTSIPNPITNGTLALVQNIGRDRAYGLEIESAWRPIDRLRVNAALNWMHARELEYAVNTFSYGFCGVVAGNCAGFSAATLGVQGTPFPNPVSDPNRFVPLLNSSGQQVVVGGVPQYLYVIAGRGADGTRYTSKRALSPDFTAQVELAYDVPLGHGGTLTPDVQSYYNSGYILTDLTPNFGNQKAYTKTDLRLTYLTAGGKFSAQAFVQNVGDEAVVTRVAYSGNRSLGAFFAMPRTYGVSVGYRF